MARYYLELLGIMASFTRTPYRQWKSIQMMAERRQLRDEVHYLPPLYARSHSPSHETFNIYSSTAREGGVRTYMAHTLPETESGTLSLMSVVLS